MHSFLALLQPTSINHTVFFFCRIPVVLENRRSSQGRVRTPGTLPLDLPLGGKGDGVSGKNNNNNDNNKKKKKKGDESLTLE